MLYFLLFYIAKSFPGLSTLLVRGLESAGHISTSYRLTVSTMACLRLRGALLWNELPDYIKNIRSINKFNLN